MDISLTRSAPEATDETLLYRSLLSRLHHYFSELLPSLSALADDGHSIDHVTAKLLDGATSTSLSGFTIPVYCAASQQEARTRALFELICFHAVRTRGRVVQARQKRLYGSRAVPFSPSPPSPSQLERLTRAQGPEPSRPASGASLPSARSSMRLGEDLTPERPSSAPRSGESHGSRRPSQGGITSLTFGEDDTHHRRSECCQQQQQEQQWSAHARRRSQSQSSGPGVASATSSIASSSSVLSWMPASRAPSSHDGLTGGGGFGGSARSSCLTFPRSNNYVGGGRTGVAPGAPRAASRQDERLLPPSSQPREPPPSTSELADAFPQPVHAEQCPWHATAQQRVCEARHAAADASTAGASTEDGTLPLVWPSQLFAVFTDCDAQLTAPSSTTARPQFCAVCAAQLWLQRMWVCVRHLRRLDQVSQLHVDVVPFSLSSSRSAAATTTADAAITAPTPREMLLHRYHVARRLGLLGLEMALGACVTRVGAQTRALERTKDVYGAVESSDHAARPGHDHLSPRSPSRAMWASEIVDDACADWAQTAALASLNTAVGLLADSSVLWPALLTPPRGSVEGQKHGMQKEGERTGSALEAHVRAWYGKERDHNLALVMRASLLRAVLVLFTDHRGSYAALTALSQLAAQLTYTLAIGELASPDTYHDACPLSVTVEVLLAHVGRWHQDWQRKKANLMARKKVLQADLSVRAGASHHAQRDDDDAVLEKEEKALWELAHFQHILGLMVIFADLVSDRDEGDEADNTDAEARAECQRARYTRLLTRALPLLVVSIRSFWIDARDEAADGGAAVRARRALALTHLITAEVHRWLRAHPHMAWAPQISPSQRETTTSFRAVSSLFDGAANEDEKAKKIDQAQAAIDATLRASEAQSRETLLQLANSAITESGAARAFVGATMMLSTALESSSSWRVRLPRRGDACGGQPSWSATACVVTELAVMPVQWIRLWCVMCSFLFPSSCLAEFMSLHEDVGDAGERERADKADAQEPGTASLQSVRNVRKDAGPPSSPRTQKHASPAEQAKHLPRAASRGRVPRQGGAAVSTAPSPPATRKVQARKRSPSTPAKSKRSRSVERCGVDGRDEKAAEARLDQLRQQLWYAPAELPFHWRWSRLRAREPPMAVGGRWLYAISGAPSSCVSGSAWTRSRLGGSHDVVAASLSALTNALSPLSRRRDIFSEPFASVLVESHNTKQYRKKDENENGRHDGGLDTASVARHPLATSETLCADLDALYGPLSEASTGEEGEELQKPASSRARLWQTDATACDVETSPRDTHAPVVDEPVFAGVPTSSVVRDSKMLQAVVQTYATRRLPTFALQQQQQQEKEQLQVPLEAPSPPPPATHEVTTVTSAPLPASTTCVLSDAVSPPHQRRSRSPLASSSSTSPPLSTTPKLVPASHGGSSSPLNQSSPARSMHATQGPNDATMRSAEVQAARAWDMSGATTDRRASSHGGSVASLASSPITPVPALQMRIAGRLSRRPVLATASTLTRHPVHTSTTTTTTTTTTTRPASGTS